MILRLCAECDEVVGDHLAFGVRDHAHAASCEDLEAEVAAAFGPFVGLLGQDAADQADDALAVGEDADTVGAAAVGWS